LHPPGALSYLVFGNQAPGSSRPAQEDARARDLVQRHVCNDWRVLQRQLACEPQQASAVVHSVLADLAEAISGTAESGLSQIPGHLTVPGSAQAWEEAFVKEFVRPLTQNPVQAAAAYLQELQRREEDGAEGSSAGIRRGALEMEIEERDFHMTEEYRAEWRPRLLRIRRRPDFAHFQATFLLDSENSNRFPFLRVFLEHEDQLGLVKELVPLVEWSNLALTRFGNQVDRQEAERTSVGQAVAQSDDM
jgi:hypothetical protein